jgi:hypothetical protein
LNPPYKSFVRKIIHQRKDKDMDKQVIVRDIKREVGNWPCQSDIARYLGKSRDYVMTLMEGCEYITDGKKKQYLAADVAERLMSKRRSN